MEYLYRHFIHFIVLSMVLLFSAGRAESVISIQSESVSIVDVTPSGFSIVWQTTEYGVPGISIFADADSVTEITNQLETILFPLQGGNPAITDEYVQSGEMADIRSQAMNYGVMKIRVEGCTPETNYYFQIFAKGADNETAVWPEGLLSSVTTAKENSFIADSKQLLVAVDDYGGTYDPVGWIVIAYGSDPLFGVSSFVGDGAASNQAFLNLSNLFGSDGYNWTPSGLVEITLEIRRGWQTATIYKTLELDYSNNFNVSTIEPVDTLCVPDNPAVEVCDGRDNDCNGEIDEGFADVDSDSIADCVDTCPDDPDNDIDGDTVCGDVDNCPSTDNTDQADIDQDGVGDACDDNVMGDIDGNVCVDILDVLCLYLKVIGDSSSCIDAVDINTCIPCDIDGNGNVDILDVLCLYLKVIGDSSSCLDSLSLPSCN